ncbi:MAG: acyl-ACP--UDP-N-acetylglucosamine O-acyltransferase [SAR324 cluster bacterium]
MRRQERGPQARSGSKALGATIHPTAIVDPKAELGRGITVGPYSVIGRDVVIGDGCELMSHVTIQGATVIGKDNRFFPHCCVGGEPQDKKYKGEPESRLQIGDRNVIREFVTLNRGSVHGGGVTRLGNDNWIMAYSHIAHDCQVGDWTIFANASTLGGHCVVEDRVYLGGFTAVHQFCTIGTLTMTGGQTMIAQDVPPFVIASGNRVRLFGVNRIGMERAGIPAEEVQNVERAYRLFFRSKLSAKEGLARIDAELTGSPLAQRFARFIRESKRGICR